MGDIPLASLSGARVIYVMATAHEYTRALQDRISPLITGVGPVEAAAGLAGALSTLEARASLPDLIVALGSAGSRTLEHAAVYQVSTVCYRDMDCRAIGFERGVTPFSDDPAVLPLGPRIPGLPVATLSSGAAIVNGAEYDAAGAGMADMADMETFAYAHVARRFSRPLIALRGVSDGRDPLTHLGDWTKTLDAIGVGLADALTMLEQALAAGAVALAPKG